MATKKELLHDLFPDLHPSVAKKHKKKRKAREETPIFEINDDDFDIKALMDSAEDPHTGTLRDLKVDDRDLTVAKNFYDFSFTIIGKDSNPPWARQLWAGAMLFSEICPRCSNPKWLDIENVPKDFRSKDLPEHIQFLEHGKCPKCKARKSELVLAKKMRNYVELVLVWGQRSGKSESAAFYSSYILHRFLKFPKLSTMMPGALQASTPLTATFVSLTATKAINLLWTPFMNKINGSAWFCLDGSTEITLATGDTKRLDAMLAGDRVKTLEGSNMVSRVFDNGIKACKELVLENGSTLTGTDSHQVRCLSEDRQSLVWKKIAELTLNDFVVIE